MTYVSWVERHWITFQHSVLNFAISKHVDPGMNIVISNK